jgi:hypothetical protein
MEKSIYGLINYAYYRSIWLKSEAVQQRLVVFHTEFQHLEIKRFTEQLETSMHCHGRTTVYDEKNG